MATRNDVTGDLLVSWGSAKYRKNFDLLRCTDIEEKLFEVFFCGRCHIKVSTSDGHCPCCTKELKND